MQQQYTQADMDRMERAGIEACGIRDREIARLRAATTELRRIIEAARDHTFCVTTREVLSEALSEVAQVFDGEPSLAAGPVTRYFRPRDAVRYIPGHAHDNAFHPDVQDGIVCSVNDEFVFVRFGENEHGQACSPEDLILLRRP